jgi:hypothetical protein
MWVLGRMLTGRGSLTDSWQRRTISPSTCAVLQNSNTPARNASRSDAGGPSFRVAGFEDSLSDEAEELLCRPLKSASQARRAPRPGRWQSRKDDDEDEYDGPIARGLSA